MIKRSLAVRLTAVCVVLAAPLLPPAQRRGEGRSVMLVVDRSESVGAEGRVQARRYVEEVWERRGPTRLGVVAFDREAELRSPVDGLREAAASAPPVVGEPAARGSDVAAAVRLAAAALPDTGERRIVLLSDGRATRGDALAEVRRARAAGIQVDAVPIGGASASPTGVLRLAAREARLSDGEPAQLDADVRGPPGEFLRVIWRRDGQVVHDERVLLGDSGAATITYYDRRPGPGAHVYEARSGSGADGAAVAVDVAGKPRALVLTADGECPGVLCDALDKADLDRKVAPLGEVPLDAASLSGADLVVLADVPLSPAGGAEDMGLGPRAQEELIAFAQRGGGVLVTGGAFGFAPEYGDAPIARMLPVEIENQGQIEDPRVAMAIMLDRSGSMSAKVGAHTKIQLASEAALAAAATLRADDALAIGSVDTRTTWNFPLGPVTGLAAQRDRIRSIDADGGGIYVYTSLVDAYGVLRRASAPLRHVILFADTADAEEQAESCPYGSCAGAENTAESIAEAARKTGISTSVVGIGHESDSDTAFLRRLAAAGGGRFYITSNAGELRRIFVSETRVATRSNLRAGPVSVDAAEDHPILAGVDVSRFPPLGGFVDARRRATAETAIVTHDDKKPILASWRYGLGKVVALTTDLRADWRHGWTGHDQAGQILRQAVRFALRKHGAGAADVRVAVGDRGATVSVDLADDADGAAAPAAVEAYAFAAGATPTLVPAALERVAPGRYVAKVATGGQPFVVARVRDAAGGAVGGAIGQTDAAGELSAFGPDQRALRDLAGEGGGEYDPEPALALRRGEARGLEPVPVWPLALLFAAALVVVDLWLRRTGRGRQADAVTLADLVPTPTAGEAG